MGWVAVYSWIGAFLALRRDQQILGGVLVGVGTMMGAPEILALVVMRITYDTLTLIGG